MRIHIVACRVLMRELSYYASQSPNTIEITWLPQGLHNTPGLLRTRVIEAIDGIYKNKDELEYYEMPDVIVLGYGLCSNGVVGVAARDIPIVVPKTDDCVALFLGSQKRYLELFKTYNGAYWLNGGWISYGNIPFRGRYEAKYKHYAELYGEDNAEFLIEQDKLWLKKYNACALISSSVFDTPEYARLASEIAEDNGWEFARFEGDNRMLKALCEGTWTEDEFLVCPPGYVIEAAYDGSKLKAVKLEK